MEGKGETRGRKKSRGHTARTARTAHGAGKKRTPAHAHRFPDTHVPASLSAGDRRRQTEWPAASRSAYERGRYVNRPPLTSFHSRRSPHIARAERLYRRPFSELMARVPGCSPELQQQILRKGRGAFYSSGSRPNQTPSAWALARLASAISGGRAARVDRHIIEKHCAPGSTAVELLHKNFP